MSQTIILELPEELALRAKEVASRTQRRVEEVLVDWLHQAVADPPIEALSDDQILALCDLQMDPEENEKLSDFLARNQEGLLNDEERVQLDELMQIYRRGLLRKAQAIKVAVERRLRAPLTDINGS